MFKAAPTYTYQNTVVGTWGVFETPAGAVSYVLTKARLGTTGTDNERRLTSQLRPVREVLNASTLDFNQLLQRDLDDHRVATDLLPYLLQPKPTGPAFFPPIMAVLLPFNGKTPVDDFPALDEPRTVEDEDGLEMLEQACGNAYRVRTLAHHKQPHPTIRLGKLSWNEEFAKLVVLDGQHRAMALIAVDRTINDTWSQGPGERFSHFYRHRVERLVEEAKASGSQLQLEKVEVPVLVAWFPKLTGPGSNAHRAARKLFVDVNKEARQPSEARLTLLSDGQLVNIFTRALLNRLREPVPPLPLFAIEYDNPEKDAARPVRWSVLTNLTLLKNAVQVTVFGPDKYVEDMGRRFGGRLGWSEMNKRMQRELQVDTIFPALITEEGRVIERSALGNENFPITLVGQLIDRLKSTWGSAVLTILGKLLPYEAHCSALSELEAEWVTDGAMSSLAKEALFVGVGMFWTLRSSDAHWKETAKKLREEQKAIPPAPEITKGWSILEDKQKRFEFLRAVRYLGKSDPESVAKSNALYGIANTQACQLGAVLAFATLANVQSWKGEQLATAAEKVVGAWNKGLLGKVNKSTDRRLLFCKDETIKSPINRIRKLDTPLAVFFRYFWLELLRSPESAEVLENFVSRSELDALVLRARTNYFRYLVDESERDLKASNPELKAKKRAEKAQTQESSALKKALTYWFVADGFDAWLESATTAEADDVTSDEDVETEELVVDAEGHQGAEDPSDPFSGLSPD